MKLGWGTGYVTHNLAEKVALYRAADIPVCFGGTLGRSGDPAGQAGSNSGNWRLSLGSVPCRDLQRSDRYVDEGEGGLYSGAFSKDFIVLTEVGSKDSEKIIPPFRWVDMIQADLDAGAWKVICEARESGTVGLVLRIRRSSVRSDRRNLCTKIDHADLIFETPQKTQQVYMVKKLGSEVNLGNISTTEVIPLWKRLRLGLRGDTMGDFHDVDIWNKRRGAELAAEISRRPERRERKSRPAQIDPDSLR
ncbi:phosphosulfolactate synthase [Achromobacter marplatensis]|uniref:phosphosulfolactate synthase n=1 Tax=Achromobacter marplatensis TaxID=470868 RepID=UPI003C729BD9